MPKRFPAHIILIILIGICITSFVIIKASSSSFTHDESFSYLLYPHSSFMEIVTYDNSYANNHILNSLFMKYSEQLFGNSEIALRLPNIMLLLVYLLYGYLLLRKCNRFLTVTIFLLLCTNIMLTDLFGLARGYGLSIGFMFMSLYHLIRSAQQQKPRHLILFSISAMLAILSNFSLLNFYLSAILIYNLVLFIESRVGSKDRFRFVKINKINIILFIISFVILYEPVRRFVKFNVVDFGGKTGFFSDTVTSLIENIFYGVDLSPFMITIIQVLMIIIVALPLYIIIRKIKLRDRDFFRDFKGMIITDLLLILVPSAMVLQHYFFGTNYAIGRFSIFLFPLLVIHLVYFLQYIFEKGRSISVYIIAAVLSTASVLFFCTKEDIYVCAEWRFDRETKHMLKDLSAQHRQDTLFKDSVKLGINWLFEPTINFYRKTLKLGWLAHADRNGINEDQDYYYIFGEDIKVLDPADYKVIKEYKKTNTYLLENLSKKD